MSQDITEHAGESWPGDDREMIETLERTEIRVEKTETGLMLWCCLRYGVGLLLFDIVDRNATGCWHGLPGLERKLEG